MKNTFIKSATAAGMALCIAGGAHASGARLGADLTPIGGIKAGSGDIPEWTGGVTKAPAGYSEGKHHPSPFADDKPKMTIDASNVDAHKDKLSDGLQAMLKKWSTLKLNVYPTRRSAAYPQRIYDALKANADNAKLASGGNGVINAVGASPFPVIETSDADAGIKVIWNHILRYRGENVVRLSNTAVVDPSGNSNPVFQKEQIMFHFSKPGMTVDNLNNIVFKYIRKIQKPARLSGTRVLVHETLDQVKEARKAWLYDDGRKRITRAPDVAYDTLEAGLGGQRTVDNVDMYNGAPDRYEWKLIGRKEMYIPYNSYGIHKQMPIESLTMPGHLKPELLRYELHRVWVVEANLRDGQRHVYAKRVFYVDEDSWSIVGYDQYDGKGQLWKVGEGFTIQYYNVPTTWTTVETQYDLLDGKYVASGVAGEDGPVMDFTVNFEDKDFVPNALKRKD